LGREHGDDLAELAVVLIGRGVVAAEAGRRRGLQRGRDTLDRFVDLVTGQRIGEHVLDAGAQRLLEQRGRQLVGDEDRTELRVLLEEAVRREERTVLRARGPEYGDDRRAPEAGRQLVERLEGADPLADELDQA